MPEEEKACLLESLRILSTESYACSKVSTECAVNDQQESPGKSITMNGNHERSTRGKRSKNKPNGTTQKNSTRSSKLRQPANSANARRSSQNTEEATSIKESHFASAEGKPVTVVVATA